MPTSFFLMFLLPEIIDSATVKIVLAVLHYFPTPLAFPASDIFPASPLFLFSLTWRSKLTSSVRPSREFFSFGIERT